MNMPSYRTTLLIDDDHINNFITTCLLQKSGFSDKVVAVKNGEEAVSYIKNLQRQNIAIPDLIFLDMNMPGMSGQDFLKSLTGMVKEGELPKVVVVSNSVRESDKTAMEKLGITLFMEKPVSKEKLAMISSN